MNKSIVSVLISVTLAVPMLAGAHSEEYFDSINAPHGGKMRMAGPYHLELVAKEKEVLLYVMDHADTEISTEGGVGKAIIQTGKAKPKNPIKLESAGGNTLRGAGNFSLTRETVITIFLKLPGHEAQSARFAPLEPKATIKAKSQDEKNSPGGHNKHTDH